MSVLPKYYRKEDQENSGFKVKDFLFTSLMMTAGAVILAVGYSFFIIPHQLVPGGVTGISIILNQLTGFPIGMLAIAVNIPLFLFGVKVLGKRFALKSFIAMSMCSVAIDVILHFTDKKALTDDILVSSLLGGGLIGIGIAMVIMVGATTGGTDIVARLMAKFSKSPVGKMFLIVDGLIVGASIVVFAKVDIALYAVVTIFVISKTVDSLILGAKQKKVAIIISEHLCKIRHLILHEMDRGGTYLMAKGLYFDEKDDRVIFTALSRQEMAFLQTEVHKIDPQAFMIILDTHDVIGSGFKSFI